MTTHLNTILIYYTLHVATFFTTYLVQVYCRIRPLENRHGESCVKVLDTRVLQLTSPEVRATAVMFYTLYT